LSDQSAPDPLMAQAWARERHRGQLYGGAPYDTHLEATAEVLRRFGYGDPVLLSAAYLHDTIEDTGATPEEIARLFGERVASIVAAVSDPAGATRGERKAAAYPRIALIPDAVRVKLADRIANVEAGGSMVAQYRGEHDGFRRALRTDGIAEEMWEHLDGLLAR
jgi:(p)ppGpp synthase/HD superfamily hydrolase